MSIFPDDEKHMDNSKYLKISKIPEGEEVRIRFVSKGIVGWEDWTKDKKPVLYKAKEARPPLDPEKPLKKFFACLIWNYSLERLQILNITQAKVKEALKALEHKRGEATGYDLKIIKTGEGKNSVYTVLGCPASALPKSAEVALKQTPVRLEALYESKDPWTDLEASEFDTQPIEVASSAQKPIDVLLDQLEIEGIDAAYLPAYIEELSSKKGQSPDHVVESALQPLLFPKFKATYLKYLAKSQETHATAV